MIKIQGMGNEGKFNYIIVNKDKTFFEWLSKLLYESFSIYDADKKEYEDKKGRWVRRKKQINQFTDKHEFYFSTKARVDVFYGRNKVFITINTSPQNRKKFMKILKKNSVWKHYKKSKTL